MTPTPSATSVLAPSGRLDASHAPRLRQDITALLGQGDNRLVVNLSGVHYLSSSILRVLLSGHRQALRAGGALALCCLQPQVLRVFTLVGFDQVLTICNDEADARLSVLSAAPRRTDRGDAR